MNSRRITILAFLVLSAIACQKESETPPVQAESSESLLELINTERISREAVYLDEKDARQVAAKFRNIRSPTRSSSEVRSVFPIGYDNDKPLMYAVNYSDGYAIISATKKNYPIMAYVEHGSFSPQGSNPGLAEIIAEYKIMQSALMNPSDSISVNYSHDWSIYEEIESVIQTKTCDNEEYYEMLDPYLAEWLRDGYNVHYLSDKPEGMPDDLYESYCLDAEGEMGDDEEFPFMDCAIITYKDYSTHERVGPFLTTKWGQRSPYNDADPSKRRLGCTTIAAGQIMRFHEFPAYFNWDDMPDTTSNSNLSNFLYTLRKEIGVSDSGSATIDQVKSALKGYGYTVKQINHDASKVKSSLNSGNPVCMRGDNGGNTGHAWVCDGSYDSMSWTEYNLYEVIFDSGHHVAMNRINQDNIYNSFVNLFHMNWGWYGIDNGYYIDSRLNPTEANYTKSRKDLLISK